MSRILALDQGTTSSRALVFDGSGAVLASAQREFAQHYPRPGWVEHDPEEIWSTQLATAREALDAAGCGIAEVAAIGITNQRETTILWDRASGKPVHPAIVWQDRRTADVTDRLRAEGNAELVRDRSGLVLDPYFSASKIAWILDQDPALRRRAEDGELAFGTVDSWLTWNLSAGEAHVTDVTNASRTSLFDLRRLDWDDELLALFRVPRAVLPTVRPSAGSFATATALGGRIAITGIAGDQHAALFGQACAEPGMAKITYGTGAFALLNTGTGPRYADGVLTTLGWQLGDEPPVYATEGAVFIAGAAVQWLRDELQLIASAGEIEALASQVADSGGVCFVPAFAGLATPHWDPHARGTIVGLTRGSGRAHLARACLDGIAHQSADAILAMAGDADLAELRVDGGARANALLLQTQADLLGRPVLRPVNTETTVTGAAWLAEIGAGLADRETVMARWESDHRAEPQLDADARRRSRRAWQRAVDAARGWAADRDEDES